MESNSGWILRICTLNDVGDSLFLAGVFCHVLLFLVRAHEDVTELPGIQGHAQQPASQMLHSCSHSQLLTHQQCHVGSPLIEGPRTLSMHPMAQSSSQTSSNGVILIAPTPPTFPRQTQSPLGEMLKSSPQHHRCVQPALVPPPPAQPS